MRRNFIAVFILLATLLIVNVASYRLDKKSKGKRTEFTQCPLDMPDPPNPLGVTLSPDPVVFGQSDDITISGSLKVDIPKDSKAHVTVAFLNACLASIVEPTTVEFCFVKGIECPLKAGNPFKGVLEGVSVPDDKSLFTISIAIRDESSDWLGCALSNPLCLNDDDSKNFFSSS